MFLEKGLVNSRGRCHQKILVQFQSIMKGLTMKIVVLFFSYLLLKMCQALDCEEEETEDFCILKGYKRSKLPPYPPLNISMSLSISVRY